MNSIFTATAILAGTGFSASAMAFTPFVNTGFEAPAYVLGNLNGQQGWAVNPGDATGMVQDEQVGHGSQAVALTDGDSFASARNVFNSKVDLRGVSSRFALYLGEDWFENVGVEPNRAGASVALRSKTLGDFTIGFGILVAPSGGYMGVSGGQSALYVELERAGTIFASTYHEVSSSSIVEGWHSYHQFYSSDSQNAFFFFDNQPIAVIPVFETIDFAYLMELRNERIGVGPGAAACFDTVICEQLPEPATVFALAVGGAGLITRRYRRPQPLR